MRNIIRFSHGLKQLSSGGDVINLGVPRFTSVPPLILLSSPLSSGLFTGSEYRARSPAAKHFDEIYLQSNSLIKSTLMFNVLQKSACMQISATVGRIDRPTMHALQAM